MTLVFVYGTLKRGGSNHHHLAGQEFVAPARTGPGYRLYQLGEYPGLVASPGATAAITGEVWSVDDACLAALDRLEGTAEGLYARVPVALEGSFNPGAVQAYLYLRDVGGRTECGPTWKV
jgi:gamma-glutamylcyclotransferase (GGCT)/AIG2-like uncharacterized protein YtfP